ncbi:acyl-CoA thioesterase [Aquimarina brevivitae]|uniref:Acyl-CoA thioester hydrolase n=1 Tax=Aquimarina brevivitae TaxID=323412 RepID=A0A4Q7PFL1_9FLAO|nr:thioesterase family protein [Aquimarina brevivitae]RZS99125.1 acyl-CoA thioester hydrolase [Aquimarina brevivitae]
MYIKDFEIRWNDIDANRHLANKAYVEFAAHTRMSFLTENGFDQKMLGTHNIGPIVFYEHIYYFKEVFAGRPVQVSLELSGLSKDGMFFEFQHHFYDHKGNNFAHSEMMGAWMDLKTRKLIGLPEEFYGLLDRVPKPEDFKVLTKEDTRKFAKRPKNLR